MMAKIILCECADPGVRAGTLLEVECLKGYGTIKRLGTTAVEDAGKCDNDGCGFDGNVFPLH